LQPAGGHVTAGVSVVVYEPVIVFDDPFHVHLSKRSTAEIIGVYFYEVIL
jgi:hypothetical protein